MTTDLFPDAPVSLEAQIACVKRELAFRDRVYRRQIADGKMTIDLAEHEQRAMSAVLQTLEWVHRECS